MKYVLEWCVRPGIGGQQAEADTQRAYDLYSKWQPKVTILQFVGRVDAEGGFMVCEADNPADILEGTAKLANYVQYKCHPVVDLAEWVQAGLKASGSATALADPSSKTPSRLMGDHPHEVLPLSDCLGTQ